MDRLLTEIEQLRVEIAVQSMTLDRVELSLALLYRELRNHNRRLLLRPLPSAED